MNLITPIKQSGKADCGFTCLEMVLRYYGCNIQREEIERQLIKDSYGGTYLTELARFAQKVGLKATCYAYNLYITHPSDALLPSGKLVTKLINQYERLKDLWYAPLLRSTIKALKDDIEYHIEKPKLNKIKKYLRDGVPLIITVNYSTLHKVQGDPFMGHDIVLTRLKGNSIFFIDPANGEEQKEEGNNLMFALLQRKIIAASAYMLAIER